MVNPQQKNYIILGLSLISSILLIVQFMHSRQQNNFVHPSLVPVNVSSDSKKIEMKTPYEQNQVKNTIGKHNSEIQACYFKHLETPKPVTMGRVSVDWHISPEGKVISPQVINSTMDNKSLGECIVKEVQKFEFPPPPTDKPLYATFSYVFHKQGESTAPQLISNPAKGNKPKREKR